ncbi:MAG: hypothetical protein ACP5OC_00980 [Thermoplasmata archaeon]
MKRTEFRMIDPGTRIDIEESIVEFVKDKRWFGSKGKSIQRVEVEYFSPFTEHFFLCICRFFYDDGSSERYFVPFSLRGSGNSFVAVRFNIGTRKLYDATDDPEFVLAFACLIFDPGRFPSGNGQVKAEKTSFSQNEEFPDGVVKKITAEQSNTSIVIGNKLILKIYRKIIGANNPDYRIPVLLWQKSGFRQTPMPVGKVELDLGDKFLIATLFRYLQGSTDGWSRFTGRLQSSLQNDTSMRGLLLLDDASLLGSLTGSMHSALYAITPKSELSFHSYCKELMLPGIQANLEDIQHVFTIHKNLPELIQIKITNLLDSKSKHLERFHAMAEKLQDQSLMVVHGDYHLGQVLYQDGSYYVIDFEGEPMRNASGSFILSLPYKDVAGMIRSFDYALAYSLKASSKSISRKFRIGWLNDMMRQFLQSYTEKSNIVVEMELLDLFLAEKAIYELKYELNNRPDWVDIPLTFLERL